jgi:hypothetical protein
LGTKHNDQEMQLQNPFHYKAIIIGTLSKKQIIKASKTHGFQIKNICKINAFAIIQYFMLMKVHRNKSCLDWATYISSVLKATFNKYAVFNRINQPFANTLKSSIKKYYFLIIFIM